MAVFFTSIAKATGTAYLRITGLSKCKQNSSFQTGFQSLNASVGRWTLSWKQQNVPSSRQRNSTGRAALRSDFPFSFKTACCIDPNSFKHKVSQIEASVFSLLRRFPKKSALRFEAPAAGLPLQSACCSSPDDRRLQMNRWHLSGQVGGL